jgi:sugar diacid utilization regulator
MEAAQDTFASLTSLVRVAVHSDDSARLITAAGVCSRLPLALVGPHGEPLGYAPAGSEGRRALAIAQAAARNRLVTAVGWTIAPIRRGSSLGFLAIGTRDRGDAKTQALLDMLPELVAEQLHRVALLRAHREAFVRRLVSDRRFGAQEIQAEGDDLGLHLAGAYWPAIVTWHATAPPLPAIERLARDALSRAEGSLAALLRGRIVLLHPTDAAHAEPSATIAWLTEIVAQARALAPSFPAQAIMGEAVELAGVSAEVTELDALRRLGPRAEHGGPVVRSRAYALEHLVWHHADLVAIRRFVDAQLEQLTRWDHEHRTDMLSVLEAALDFPRHDQAASRCFMHRNTFRHRLQQASEVLGTTLEDPDERLALHVALKLRRLLAMSSTEQGTAEARGGPSTNGRQAKAGPSDALRVLARRPLGRRA